MPATSAPAATPPRAKRFFRGTQTSGADGRVDFNSCFPGWYAGRAVHIHLQVRRDGDTYAVSQLFFPETVTADIFGTLDGYAAQGQPDTSLDVDNVIGGAEDKAPFIVDLARMSDGAMQASKVIVLRSSLSEAACAVAGGGGGGGPPP